jgi:hypothetical protein
MSFGKDYSNLLIFVIFIGRHDQCRKRILPLLFLLESVLQMRLHHPSRLYRLQDCRTRRRLMTMRPRCVELSAHCATAQKDEATEECSQNEPRQLIVRHNALDRRQARCCGRPPDACCLLRRSSSSRLLQGAGPKAATVPYRTPSSHLRTLALHARADLNVCSHADRVAPTVVAPAVAQAFRPAPAV